MRRSLSALVGEFCGALVASGAFAGGPAEATARSVVQPRDLGVTPRGVALSRVLDSMDVESRWVAGSHVDWMTGLPDDASETLPGRHTHCSAFVAAAAMRLGVYILRPPEHGQVLLANAQSEWLATSGRASGWRRLEGPVEAQEAANAGWLVVASYHNHRDDRPGHIAIVRPGARSEADVASIGPDVIQAGTVNSNAINIRSGFAGHVAAWRDGEIAYYGHATRATSGSIEVASPALAMLPPDR